MEHTDALRQAREEAEAARLIAEGLSENGPVATSYRDVTPVPTTGDAMPWPQPGRPPMSQRATDASGLMLAGGLASLPLGAAASLVLWASGQADPVSLAVGGTAPVALVLAIAFTARCFRGVHTETHHHYEGTVVQHTTNVDQTTRGVFASTRNQVRR
ncbi:hypothetical protein [Streptomyces sp. NPDC017529]|uniref:hypothetical protein n=1 Tax=Streptomyces sp. NPDC017529 TaxID=3365000 RepID=UPI003796F712